MLSAAYSRFATGFFKGSPRFIGSLSWSGTNWGKSSPWERMQRTTGLACNPPWRSHMAMMGRGIGMGTTKRDEHQACICFISMFVIIILWHLLILYDSLRFSKCVSRHHQYSDRMSTLKLPSSLRIVEDCCHYVSLSIVKPDLHPKS